MQTLKLSVLDDMYWQLPKYCVTAKKDIGVWEYTRGEFLGEDGYRYDDFKSTIKTGDRWLAAYDSAHFFKASVTVPDEMDGKPLRARLKVGGEALVKCNGKYVAGCTSRRTIPDRADVELGIHKGGEVLTFEVEATVDSMTYRVLDNATSFALDAIIAHVDLLRRREILQLAKDNVRQHVEILDSQKERVELGAGSSADVTQTKGRLARAQSTLTDAEASLREGEASYIRLTGKPVPASLAEVYVPEPMYTGYDAVMEVADKNNPKLKAYMSDIKAARGEKELAESAYHPKINFEVGPSYSDRSGPGSQWTSGVDAGLVMRWNLFNSGADKAGTEAAESRTRMATETLYNFHDELALEIENTWTRYLAAKEQKKYYEEAIGYNTATRDAYLEQFKLGERSLLDVLDAESELFNSSTQYTTANGNVVVGAYRLYALTGMLLPELGIKEDPLYESPRNQQEKR